MRTFFQPVVLAIGGFDPSGGAGVVRDLLTARALGAAAHLIPTAWTEQSAQGGVRSVEPRDPDALTAAIRQSLHMASGPRSGVAVKIGMLPNERAVDAVLDGVMGVQGVVFDPVLAASSGGALFAGDPAALLRMAASATLTTPNAGEAAALVGVPVRTADEAAAAGRALVARGVPAVLIKGGHLEIAGQAVDVLTDASGSRFFTGPRVPGPPVRGTGCALATAIAVGLAQGSPLPLAIQAAKAWLGDALTRPTCVGGEWHLP